MSEKEKEIMQQISDKFPKLDKTDQSYVLGVIEGMALAKGQQEAQEKLYADTVREYLSGVTDANNVNLLYAGLYPA